MTEEERTILRDLIEAALTTDGAHHKQWYLERIAWGLKLNFRVDYEPGIPP